ncbi:MAG TPA: c-type cytochrome, partial [Gemmatimonadaceae bacterium]|nr:c-type cytochrome [Gemmatimonadaceae bacterium]
MPTRPTLLRCLAIAATTLAGCRSNKPASTPAPASAVGPAATSAATRPAQITDEMVSEGQSIFNNGSCTKCHGPNGAGGPNGPSLA